ncbi:MAG: hypothetical protein E7438_01030 [Ruminococcaceae bacterium]|nr:hypothetical protein [Oscillospiraceae bacterium]
MMNNEQMLTSMLHTVQMGQSGIRCVMDNAVGTGLKTELRNQLKEYDALEKQTLKLAQKYNLQLKNLNPVVETMSSMMAKMQLMGGEQDSKIAGMLIQGNTRGMIQGLKNMRKSIATSADVKELAKQLVNTENINIQKSQTFL